MMEFFKIYLPIFSASITLLVAIFTIFNTYSHVILGRIIAELRLNLMREMNGKYVTLMQFKEFKEGLYKVPFINARASSDDK